MNVQYQEIDKARLAALVTECKAKKDFSDDELGKVVSYLCQIMLTASNYCMYTEDWQLEMVGNASLAVFRAMASEACRTENPDKLFNYIYTTISNSFKRTIAKLKLLPVQMPQEEGDAKAPDSDHNGLKPYYLRNKSRITRGILKRNADDVVKVASRMKVKLLKDVVEKATKNFFNSFEPDDIDALISMARKSREAALC